MEKKSGLLSLYISLILILSTIPLGYTLPFASAEIDWESVFSMSKTVEIPPGEDYFAYFNGDQGTIVEMMLPSLEAGFSLKAMDALSQVPSWQYEDLAKKLRDLGNTDVDVGNFATPAFTDMDADGDLDLSCGSEEGTIYYYENVGTKYWPIFIEKPDMYSFICDVWCYNKDKTALAIADLDANGAKDLLIGNSEGTIYYFQNLGSPEQAIWGPYYAIEDAEVNENSHPALADLDGDGDYDLAVGAADGYIYFYDNVGSSESPDWDYSYPLFTGENDDRTIYFSDLDDDGDFDLSVGDGDLATLYYYQNIGSSTQETWAPNPTLYSGIVPEYGTSPAIADLNGDLCPDLVVGGNSGRLFYYKNIGTASNPQWLVWSLYQIIEGYMYYPKEVFIKYMSDYWMDMYADLILGAASRYKDEIGFVIAHTPTENLKAMNKNQTQLFVDNAHLIYEIDQYLDYVEVIEKDDYTTTRYKIGELGNITQKELPRDIYYWYIVHPKITDENVFYVHPDDSDPNHPTDPVNGGRFWREYLFFHADESYPPDNSGSPNDGDDDYPAPGIQPPLLKDLLDGIEVLFNGTTWFAPAGNYSSFKETGEDNIRPFTYGNHAVVRVSNWVGKTLILNQQEVTDDERPIQPVRIAHHHNGNCGELQDLTAAAARCALIPAAGVLLLGEDHVWNEFYENGWHQWDNYWSDGGSVIDNFNNYWVGWGQRGGSGIWKIGGDDDTWELTDHYIPEEDLSYVTVRVEDNNGDPVDGARVLVITYWLTVDIEGYQISVPFPAIWNYTDSNGETLFKLATQTKANGNHNFTFKIISKVGSTQSGKLELEHGQDYTFIFTLEGSAPNPELNTNELPDPSPPNPEYRLNIDYQVESGVQFPRHPETGNSHPEEIPPDRLPELSVSDFRGNHIDSFITDEQEIIEYMKGYIFDSYQYEQDLNSDAITFDLPNIGNWYFVLSNRDSIETTKVVNLTLNLEYKPPPYSVKITSPLKGSQLNIGEIITISGLVTSEDELLSLELSTDNGTTWIHLSWMDNHWTFDWDSGSLALGVYKIEVMAQFQSTQHSDSIDVELIDNEPPSIEISSPAEYSQISIGQNVLISGTASDNIGITSLLLSYDGGTSWKDITSNLAGNQWSYSWNTWGITPGNYIIEVRASDGFNERLDSRYVELVDLAPPSVSISSPMDNSKINVGTVVWVSGEADDNVKVLSLHISTDGGQNWTDIFSSLNGTLWSYEWNTAGMPLGPRTITIKVSDGAFNVSFSLNIELGDLEAPDVSILYPEEGSQINIGSVIVISGTAIDNVEIQTLKLSTTGGGTWVNIISSLINGQWSYGWDTSECRKGQYTIKVKATDGENQEANDLVFFELIDTTSPEILIKSPLQDESFNCGDFITLQGTARDNTEITELKLSYDGEITWIDILSRLSNGNWFYDWDTTNLPGGRYTITVIGSDGSNPQTKTKIDVNLIDMEKPILEITSPVRESKYDIGDNIIIEGKALDNTGISELCISTDNGKTWIDIRKNLGDQGRWSYIWDTGELTVGTYNVRVKVSDGPNEVEDSLTIELEKGEKEEKFPIFWILLIVFAVIALIVIVAISAIVLKRRHREEEIVVVEELRY